MEEFKTRPMCPDDWTRVPIERGRYFNKEHAITGYERADGQRGTPLHPASVFEDKLRETHRKLRETYPAVSVSRHHVRMPYWDPDDPNLPNDYSFVQAPERLTTTSVTVVMVPRNQIKDAEMGFYYNGSTLPTLRERITGVSFQGLAGNLGYYMTEGLIQGKFPWSHNVRYPEFPLPTMLSYLGFHLFRDEATGEAYGSFQGVHPAAVGVRKNGQAEIIPRLEIDKYRVTLWGEEFCVHSINNPDAIDKVMLFTPGLWTSEVSQHAKNWETYAPEIPIPDRVNVFVANEGNGQVPIERVVKVWKGRSTLPSFGAVLSFERDYFEKLFASVQTFSSLDQRIKIEPLGNTDFDNYVQIMGGFVPVVVDGQHVYCVETVDQVRECLRDYGNATSPLGRSGRETNNFDTRIREPAGVLVQTEDQIGWVLFDGRHELSIGASVVDVAKILEILEHDGVLGGGVQQAIFIDGGSAMKVYAVESDGTDLCLDLLNRVAAGSRNGPGADLDGLNLYTLLKLSLL